MRQGPLAVPRRGRRGPRPAAGRGHAAIAHVVRDAPPAACSSRARAVLPSGWSTTSVIASPNASVDAVRIHPRHLLDSASAPPPDRRSGAGCRPAASAPPVYADRCPQRRRRTARPPAACRPSSCSSTPQAVVRLRQVRRLGGDARSNSARAPSAVPPEEQCRSETVAQLRVGRIELQSAAETPPRRRPSPPGRGPRIPRVSYACALSSKPVEGSHQGICRGGCPPPRDCRRCCLRPLRLHRACR